MTDTPPRLSIVATSRNDDHGGGLLRRMQIFVSGLLEQARRHHLNAELILVEWNPPADRPRLAEALIWPHDLGPCAVRIIEVPPALHHRFKYADKLPLFQMIAKNAGIRRARGAFVLATNVDLLFSDELTRFLANGALDPACMYRVDRYDVRSDVPLDVPIEEQLAFCRRNVLRVNVGPGSYSERWSQGLRGKAVHALGRAGLMPSRRLGREALDLQVLRRFLRRFVYRLGRSGYTLHLNGCGDFTLLARERWFRLRGYPEWEMFSMHLDSVLCHMAHADGAREVVLPDPHRLYHLEHGAGWTPQQNQSLKERIRKLGLPLLDLDAYEVGLARRQRDGAPVAVNDENWGVARDTLSETTIA
jgi:hypothetical protein